MHRIVADEMEAHLSGEASKAFYVHLEACPACRADVAGMEEVTLLIRDMKAEWEPAAPLGFYNRVATRIVESDRKTAWGFFSPGPVFFRRIAFASLLLLAGLGSFLVTRESAEGGADAVAIMAQHDTSVAHSESSDRDRLLVTLATYRH